MSTLLSKGTSTFSVANCARGKYDPGAHTVILFMVNSLEDRGPPFIGPAVCRLLHSRPGQVENDLRTAWPEELFSRAEEPLTALA